MTLATSALKCAKQLGRASADGTSIIALEAEIKDAIGDAIRQYNREPWHLTEVRAISLSTVAGQNWYNSVDLTAGASDQAIAGRTALDTKEILTIDYARENPGSSGLNEPLCRIGYRQFEAQLEGSTPNGPPTYYTYYAGEIGIWPTPDAVYTLYFSANVKPVVPAADSDVSVWLDEYEEMINAAACKRVAIKHLRDRERGLEFTAVEGEMREGLERENLIKTSSGKVRVRD